MWVMKMRLIWLTLRSLRSSWCWVPSPQSNSQISARWGRRRATLETLRDRVGTPELVPKKVICTGLPFNLVQGKEITSIPMVHSHSFRTVLSVLITCWRRREHGLALAHQQHLHSCAVNMVEVWAEIYLKEYNPGTNQLVCSTVPKKNQSKRIFAQAPWTQ